MYTASPDNHDFDDILGADPSPLDRPLTFTVFTDELARQKTEQVASLRDFAARAHTPTATVKSSLPLMKLAQFGDVPTLKGSLRNNANVIAIDGVEGDYDGGRVSISDGAAKLRAAGVAAVLYTSPSHTDAQPRWRVLCPLSKASLPDDREALCARLNGVLGGLLSGESFTLSQSYYFGRVDGSEPPVVEVTEGVALDLAVGLDATALGRGGDAYQPRAAGNRLQPTVDDDDDWDLQTRPDWPRIDAALAAIPVTEADQEETGGRDMWLRVGQALHHASGGSDEGFERWDTWSSGGKKYDARRIRRDWNSFRTNHRRAVRIGTLYDLAKRYGPAESIVLVETDPFDAIGTEHAAKPAPTTSLRFLTPLECTNSPRRGYVVKGLLAPRDLACIFGAPGAGKSLIAPHIGYQATLGLPAFGMRTKPGRVFYVAAEDPHGMRGRVTGLRIRHGDSPDFVLVEGVSDLLSDGSPDLVALRAAIVEQKPALIFLDTLAMSFPGLEENSADAMGRVVAIGRSLTKHGAAVILIHHDTKAQGATPRGHSLLNGALDVALQLFSRDEAGIIRGKLTKNRNGSCDRDIAFRIATETLGEDEDGDEITAALVSELCKDDLPAREKLTRSETAALGTFNALAITGCATEDAWRTACIDGFDVSTSEDRESRRKATARAIKGLVNKGAVVMDNGVARRPGTFGNAFEEDDCR